MKFGDLKGGDMFIFPQSTGEYDFSAVCYMKLDELPYLIQGEQMGKCHPFTAVSMSAGALIRIQNSAKVLKLERR